MLAITLYYTNILTPDTVDSVLSPLTSVALSPSVIYIVSITRTSRFKAVKLGTDFHSSHRVSNRYLNQSTNLLAEILN